MIQNFYNQQLVIKQSNVLHLLFNIYLRHNHIRRQTVRNYMYPVLELPRLFLYTIDKTTLNNIYHNRNKEEVALDLKILGRELRTDLC